MAELMYTGETHREMITRYIMIVNMHDADSQYMNIWNILYGCDEYLSINKDTDLWISLMIALGNNQSLNNDWWNIEESKKWKKSHYTKEHWWWDPKNWNEEKAKKLLGIND